VLTGSTRYSVLPQAAQSLTGRAYIINVLPLSQGELHGHRENFVDRLWADPARLPQIPSRPVTRDDYVDRVLAGGFPMILHRLRTRARSSWFADYINLVVMRDVLDNEDDQPVAHFSRLSCGPPCLSLGGRGDGGRRPRSPGLSSSSGNGLPSRVVRSWRTGSAPAGDPPDQLGRAPYSVLPL